MHLRVIKRSSKTAGFNNPAGRAFDLLFEGFALNRSALANRSRNPALALAHQAQWTCWSLWMLSTSPFRTTHELRD
jgi:hypothetical protein